MNQPVSEKEELLMIFSEMNEQLAELEMILKKSFSDLHKDLIREEENKLSNTEKRISQLEKGYIKREDKLEELTNYSLVKKSSAKLKLELGF